MLTISYTYRMLQRHDRSLRAKTERLFPLGIEQCRTSQNRETINLWRGYCLEVNESITILSGDDVLALPHETYARSIERGTCPRTIQYQQMEKKIPMSCSLLNVSFVEQIIELSLDFSTRFSQPCVACCVRWVPPQARNLISVHCILLHGKKR